MIKKIILTIFTLIIIAGGGLFLLNGKENYDATKYSATATDTINKGSAIDFKLPDQFDEAHSLTDDTQKVIFVFSKATGHTVKAFLREKDKNYLSTHHALFVADISPMPTVIRNTFALPDLKKSPFSVLLIYDKAIAKTFKNEAQADKIAVATLKNKTIDSIEFITTADELKAALN
jgi:uncharacterized protein YxeA